jgi:RNA-binding protein
LKRLGTVIHIIDKLLIVRADKMPEKNVSYQNSVVLSKKMSRIGRVKEIFGPVNCPYFSVSISREIPESHIKNLKNERVYLK